MKRKRPVPRDAAVEALSDCFRAYGYEGASLTRLSEAAGLGRSSLYHFFPNGKDDMARDAARHVGEDMTRRVIEPLRGEGAPAIRVGRAVAGLDEVYAGGGKACLVELFSTPDAADAAPGASRSLLSALIDAFAALAAGAGAGKAEAQERAERAAIEIQGALVLARALSDRRPFARMLKRLPGVLLGE